jgi:DNA-binding NtrC family response regulator
LFLADAKTVQSDLISDIFQSEFPGCIDILPWQDISQAACNRYDLAILILSPGGPEWAPLLAWAGSSFPHTMTMVVAEEAHGKNIDLLLESDIDDLLLQPFTSILLLNMAKRLLNSNSPNELEIIRKRLDVKLGLNQFIGKSKAFVDETLKIEKISQTISPVLIQGQTGTGKELCARAIHYLGPRSNAPFVPMNCGGLSDHLLENEMFGHVKGAYTDAHAEQKGLAYEASGGTLFLDEIHVLSPVAQIKLLRFLEDHQYKPLGSTKYIEADVRIITAANIDLKREVERERFRYDLYYRINVLSIELPMLKERLGDIPLLSEHFLNKYSAQYDRGQMYITADAMGLLCGYGWPGNVRELKNVIEKAIIMTPSNIIRADSIQIDKHVESIAKLIPSFREAKILAVDTFEKNYLLDILVSNKWNVSKAARQAVKDRRSFQRLIRKHDLSSAD